MRYLFVVNPIAGGISKEPFLHLLGNAVGEQGLDAHLLYTNGQDDAERLEEHLQRLQPDRVVAVGGDGTVQLAGQLLARRPLPLAIIPAGSANGLATELGLPNSTEECLQIALHSGEILPYDLIDINGHLCLHFADVGINADLVKDYEQDENRGLLTYAKYAFLRMGESRLHSFRLLIDGKPVEHEGYMLAMANARYLGTGVLLNTCGRLGDGAFEVVLVRDLTLGDLLRAGFSALNAEVEYGEAIECISCRELKVLLHTPLTLQIDGEVFGEVQEIEAHIRPQALELVVVEERGEGVRGRRGEGEKG